MNGKLFDLLKKCTNQIAEAKWMPFSNEFYQNIYQSLLDKANVLYDKNILIKDYDMLANNISSIAGDDPPDLLWASILQEKVDGQNFISIASFTKQGKEVGKSYLMCADTQLDKDLMLAFKQFPVLIMPASIDGEIKSHNQFRHSIPPWGGSILTYSAAIKYFAHKGRTISNVQKGVLIYEKFHSCVIVEQRFLDANDDFVCSSNGSIDGRKCLFGLLDQELKDALAGENILLVN
jgi:hypothetical protein